MELYLDDQWGPIDGSGANIDVGQTICRQLRYSKGADAVGPVEDFGYMLANDVIVNWCRDKICPGQALADIIITRWNP